MLAKIIKWCKELFSCRVLEATWQTSNLRLKIQLVIACVITAGIGGFIIFNHPLSPPDKSHEMRQIK